ncbi:MAG: DUF2279 domain-containing protein [bacterium]|nr:DUF2279 domain-containing protein [bacterium]
MKTRPILWCLFLFFFPTVNGLGANSFVDSCSALPSASTIEDSAIAYKKALVTHLFFKDTSNNFRHRKALCYTVGLGGTALAHLALSQIWYKDYPQSKFHFFNDNKEWLQMDKCGHAFSSYYLGVTAIEAAKWAGVPKNKQWRWALFGSIFQDPIEIWDGLSAGWGASVGDLAANSFGTLLSAGQHALWQEQKIKMKFSYHTTGFPALRPNTLGSTWNEQLLKDYNGQTYWLTYAPLKKYKWAGLAFGYSAYGLLGGFNNTWTDKKGVFQNYNYQPRYRQYFLSLDIDLTKIKTKHKVLKSLFSILNGIKIPFPALELSNGRLKGYGLYF